MQARRGKAWQANGWKDKASKGYSWLVMARQDITWQGQPSQAKPRQGNASKTWQANAWKDKKDKASQGN
jgi:hypothetical protein